MIIIGTGSREWKTPVAIRKVFISLIKEFGNEFKYRHGGQKGFDQYSAFIARQLKIKDIDEYCADWDQYGKSAGPIRNHLMLDTELEKLAPEENILLIAMPLENSVGTYEMIEYAKSKGVTVRIFNKEGNLVHGSQ